MKVETETGVKTQPQTKGCRRLWAAVKSWEGGLQQILLHRLQKELTILTP